MVEARARAAVPVPPREAFDAASDLSRADWLPMVHRVEHVGGPVHGVDARYEVEITVAGRRLRRVLVCREFEPPRRIVLALEQGMDLTIALEVEPAEEGSTLQLTARYAVGGGFVGAALERTSAGPARQEARRAVERLAARLSA